MSLGEQVTLAVAVQAIATVSGRVNFCRAVAIEYEYDLSSHGIKHTVRSLHHGVTFPIHWG